MSAKKYRQKLGRWGEKIARYYYEQKGYQTVAQNWRCRYGEIDLIAKKNGQYTFVEVKTRKSDNYGWPEESVDLIKLQHLQLAIEFAQEKLEISGPINLEIVTIYFKNNKAIVRRWLVELP